MRSSCLHRSVCCPDTPSSPWVRSLSTRFTRSCKIALGSSFRGQPCAHCTRRRAATRSSRSSSPERSRNVRLHTSRVKRRPYRARCASCSGLGSGRFRPRPGELCWRRRRRPSRRFSSSRPRLGSMLRRRSGLRWRRKSSRSARAGSNSPIRSSLRRPMPRPSRPRGATSMRASPGSFAISSSAHGIWLWRPKGPTPRSPPSWTRRRGSLEPAERRAPRRSSSRRRER